MAEAALGGFEEIFNPEDVQSIVSNAIVENLNEKPCDQSTLLSSRSKRKMAYLLCPLTGTAIEKWMTGPTQLWRSV